MKRMLCMLWTLLFLVSCAAPPQESPQEVPAPEPVSPDPAAPKPKQEPDGPVFSPVNPNPASDIVMESGQRRAGVDSQWVEMPAAPFVEHDAFYFPLQFLAEAMGVQYAFAGGCAYLQCDGHVTQFFIDSPRFIVDGVEGQVEGTRRLYRKGLPEGRVDEYFTPVLRDGVVFLPIEYLPAEFRSSYNSFGPQVRLDGLGNVVSFQNDRLPPVKTGSAIAVTLYAGVSEALADGERVPLPAAPFVENGSFYFPVEAVAELLGLGYLQTGNSFVLSDSEHGVRFFLNSRLFVLNGQTGHREEVRRDFAPSRGDLPVDGGFAPVERDGVVFLPANYLEDSRSFLYCDLFHLEEDPARGMVILSDPSVEEQGIGGFYLGHKFDETPPELRAGLHCIGKLGEYEGEWDIIGYAGGGLHVHVVRCKPGACNYDLDGTVSAVWTADPAIPTPRGLRCGDMPRRAWELYGHGDGSVPLFRYDCPDNGPITAIGFAYFREVTVHIGAPYYTAVGVPDEWFDTPPFWES